MKVTEGLVSTIIPVHNRPVLLREAVMSVLNQTYRPIEILIVDDGSSDSTPETADQLARENPLIRVIRQKNTGPGCARESGRLDATGEFIQYLDSDDLLLPDKFELQVQGLCRNPECGVSYGWTRYLDGSPEIKPWKRTGEQISTMFPSFLKSRWWGTSTPLYRRSLTDRAGSWTKLTHEEDWEYDCRIASLGVKLDYVPAYVSEERTLAKNRLSSGRRDHVRLRERVQAHALILHHAQNFRISAEAEEMRHFARELFLLSRQCGAAGLTDESRSMFQLARQASGTSRSNGLDFIAYRSLAGLAGWMAAGKITCYLDRFRRTSELQLHEGGNGQA